jgi:hypothetical protein
MERLQAINQFLTDNVRGVPIDAQTILANIARAPIVYSGGHDRAPPQGAPTCTLVPPRGLEPFYLDVGAFKVALDTTLKGGVAGYVAQLRQSGQILFTNTYGYAKAPKDTSELWTPDVQMHVASVSKLMTAMALMVLFNDHGISPDAPIIDYLPSYWVKGPNIESIVFRNLLNHTSGLLPNNYFVTFELMKSTIAGGINVGNLGKYSYQNLNYGLLRILLPVINGNINKNAYFGFFDQIFLNDLLWDFITIAAYGSYLQAKVFQPSNVAGATLDHPSACALAYQGPGDAGPGWNSGNLEEPSGCAGWHLSVNQLLDVMGEFRRGGGILSPGAAQAMLDNGFGVDSLTANVAVPTALPTAAGAVYCKPGDWTGPSPYRDEQALAYFLPQDMELVVFANSQVDENTGQTNYFRCVVTKAYLANLTQPPLHL